MSSPDAALAHLQRWMLDALLAPGNVDGPSLAATVLPGPRLGAAASLAIHQRSYDRELILQPCLVLGQYRWPVAGYYHAVRAGHGPELPVKSPSHLVLLRRDHQTTTYPVSALHQRFLCALQQHGSIERALADIAAWTQRPLHAVVHSWINEVRRPWIEAGFFIARASAG